MSLGISLLIGFLLSIVFLIVYFGYLVRPAVNRNVVERMTKFSLGNYTAGFIGGLPAMILPLIILNYFGAKFSAYFYMDFMISNLLFIIPMAVSQSLFVEGSYNDMELKIHVKKAMKIIFSILMPAVVITIIFGKYILLAFGKEYSSEGFLLLQIFALSSIFISINFVFGSILRVQHKIKMLIIISTFGTILILGLSYLFISTSFLGIGLAWIIGQGLTSAGYLFAVRKKF
jgi:O-antigen/teichoic acid export membrane protein